jgi:CheY-like chemotaxis protein
VAFENGEKIMMNDSSSEPIDILLVEDDKIDVEMVKRIFKKQGMINPLHHALCGIDALEMLRGQNGKQKIPQPCVMLVDINMPQMNGLEFLKEVRNDKDLRRNIAFILTTSSRASDVTDAYELNVAGYFLKNNLQKLVDMLGFYWQINKFSGQ